MARYKTLVDQPLISKAKLDLAETAPALGKGQPVVVTKWPAEGTAETLLVKVCPDGQIPDFVVGNAALSAASPGDVIAVGMPGSPVLCGGAVKRGDLLTVKSGKFQKGIAKDLCACAASQDAAAGDLIPAAAIPATA